MKPDVFLFYGFGSEYVLHDLYQEMKKRGHHCVEVDALAVEPSANIIRSLQKKNVVFITSAHFLLDKKNFSDFYPNDRRFYGVLEIIQLLKPLKSVYIPHDLTQPVIDRELEFLNQFDLFLTPCEPFTSIYSQYCPTEEIGWIKYNDQPEKKRRQPSHKAIWLLSDYVLCLKMGKETSFQQLKPVLDQGVAIKFPAWIGSREFTDYFLSQGVTVYPPIVNSIHLIQQHQVIVTNGLSSINAESYFLGKTTVNIMEGSHYGDSQPYLLELLPELVFVNQITDFQLSGIPINKRPATLQPFHLDKAISLITESV